MSKKSASEVVSRPVIAREVRRAIGSFAKKNGASTSKLNLLVNGDESLDLEDDLNLDEDSRKRLKEDYNRIGENHNAGGRISVGIISAGNCETVEDAINLTYTRANGWKKMPQ